jgi:hypothetical protein
MGTGGAIYLRIKKPGHEVDNLPPFTYETIPTPPHTSSWCGA